MLKTATGTAGVAGLAILGLAGCDLPPADVRWRSADALVPLLSGTLAMANRYDQVIAAVPALTTRLEPLRDAHRAHVVALAREVGVDETAPLGTKRPALPTPSRSASAGASQAPAARPSATPNGVPAEIPTEPAAALTQLAAAEKIGHELAVAACVAAPSYRAALLGSIAACRATHLEALRVGAA